jgi:hypothetical protein
MPKSMQLQWRAGPTAFGAALALCAQVASAVPPAEQLRRLEETGLAQARKTVRGKAELRPFAFVVREDGRTQRLDAKKSRSRRGTDASAALIEGLRSRAAAGAYRAVAVFRFVVITLPGGAKSHAIHAGMEHASGRCREVFVPYRVGDEREIRFEPELVRSRAAEIFASCDPLETPEP